MPRKKMVDRMPCTTSINTSELTEFLLDMPPDTNDVFFNNSQRKFWRDILYRFKCYWSNIAETPKDWDRNYKSVIDAHVRYYLAFYDVLFWAYDDIIYTIRVADDIDGILSELGVPDTSICTPMGFLQAVMLSDWQLSAAKKELPPQSMYTHHKLGLQVKKFSINPSKLEDLSTPDRVIFLEKLLRRLPRNYQGITSAKRFYLGVAANSRDRSVMDSLKNYEKATQTLFDAQMTMAHPR